MTTLETTLPARHASLAADGWRYAIIALIAFLTLVDLFATQAILPSLAVKYAVSPSTMGLAVNASTFGMAVAGLAIALFGRGLDRRAGIWVSLAVLSVPTTLLAFVDDIVLFAALRVWQGVCMASAFTLTMAYLAEHFSAGRATAALSAYVTGNVASNVFGRMLSAAVADGLGIEVNFLTFAALNLAGAALVLATLSRTSRMMACSPTGERRRARDLLSLFGNSQLAPAFAVGFLILFVFIGTYTYVNFRLTGPAIGLSPMALGLVYLVFLPSLVTTPLAGAVAARLGAAGGITATLGLAVVGVLLCLPENLAVVLVGLALIAVGTFLAQAIATGHVGRTAGAERAAASGVYLSSYYAGGLAGSFVLGQVHDRLGWTACVWVLAATLVLGAAVALRLRRPA
ncbi:MAG: MFS transporter [Alphaproteobacteria bacterium]|nr:MAG: MFS transporter [Alphaproteobacteria bacterium]